MNRREEPVPARTRKKINKQLRALVDTKGVVPAPRNLHGQNLAKRPKKKVVQEISRKKTLLKEMEISKKKKHSHHSKRASPGTVDERPSSPSSVHKESQRWIQTVEKQNVQKAQRLVRKLSKKR